MVVNLLRITSKVHDPLNEFADVFKELRRCLLSRFQFLHHVIHVEEHLLELYHLIHLLAFRIDYLKGFFSNNLILKLREVLSPVLSEILYEIEILLM